MKLNDIECALSQALANPDVLNQSIMDIIEVYERSITRKNSEIEVIKSCLEKEKEKLINEQESIN